MSLWAYSSPADERKTGGNLFHWGKLPDDRSKTDKAHVVTMNKTVSHVLYKEEYY